MAKYVIEDTTLTGIADAIRSKEGTTAGIPVPDMSQRILEIQTGIDTSGATAEEADVIDGKIYYANGEEKTGTMPVITGIETELAAGGSFDISLGYHDGTGKVTAKDLASQTVGDATENSIVTGKSAWVNGELVNGQIPIGTTFTSATEIELAAGESLAIPVAYYSKGGTVVAKDLASQTEATAVKESILYGETAWVNGVKITGLMAKKGAATFTPGTEDQTIATGWYIAGIQTIKGDANLVASNIKSGVSIFGVDGSLVEQEDLSSEISTQQSLISQIETALANKAAAS